MNFQQSQNGRHMFDAIDMQGASQKYVTRIPELHSLLHELHHRLNRGENVQPLIDAHIPICLLELSDNKLLEMVDWQLLVLSEDQIPSIHHLPDIGCHIRMIFSDMQPTQHNAFLKILNYSMPFIKHNRLSFPPLRDFSTAHLFDLLQISMFSLLGLFPTCKKQPLFYNRVFVCGLIHTLMASADIQHIHAFCQQHLHIIRVSVMEFFLYFLETNMPVEYGLMQAMFHTYVNIRSIITQLRVCIDNFRQKSLQQHLQSMQSVNAVAQQCNDRCNRICKGKFKYKRKAVLAKRRVSFSKDAMQLAFEAPRFAHKFYMHRAYPNVSHEIISHAHHIQQCVQIFDMPENLKRAQFQAVRKLANLHISSAARSIYLHFCFSCKLLDRGGIDNMMRVDGNMNVLCNRCRTCDHVLSINSLGRFIGIDHQTFFFCVECNKIHAWTPTAHGFSCGAAADPIFSRQPESTTPEPAASPTALKSGSMAQRTGTTLRKARSQLPTAQAHIKANQCILCYRSVNLAQLKLMHSTEALFFDVNLCKWHTPLCNMIPYINTIHDLHGALQQKQEYYAKK